MDKYILIAFYEGVEDEIYKALAKEGIDFWFVTKAQWNDEKKLLESVNESSKQRRMVVRV